MEMASTTPDFTATPAATPAVAPAATPAAPPAKPSAPDPEPELTAKQWAAGNASLRVPLAGLLAAEPDLRTAQLTPDEWTQQLEDYLSSERV